MNRIPLVLVALAGLAACGKKEPVPPVPSSAPGGASSSTASRPEKVANGQPAVITVKHVLISFKGAAQSKESRTQAEAEKLAFEVINRANSGEDFDKIMKELSSDPGEGTYTLVNQGISANPGEFERSGMVAAFGDVGFRIAVGEVGLADYDAKGSPFGLHIIKRVK
ncbi:MAG TPA: peptidylprolyl isomerase [Planctomycetota bacterium]|nr:peptidylprolyl isomerase [Planctomycetota bacterium]